MNWITCPDCNGSETVFVKSLPPYDKSPVKAWRRAIATCKRCYPYYNGMIPATEADKKEFEMKMKELNK